MSSLRHYVCGHTHHNARQMFRGAPKQVRQFPSGAFLYDNGSARVLFDTGYRTDAWNAGWKAAAYRRLLPPVTQAADDIAAQLEADHGGQPEAAVVIDADGHLRDDRRVGDRDRALRGDRLDR